MRKDERLVLDFLKFRDSKDHDAREDLFDAAASIQYQDKTFDYKKQTWKDKPHYYVWFDCSDIFFWGCSDAEELTHENWHLFEEAFDVVYAAWKKVQDQDYAAFNAWVERRKANKEATGDYGDEPYPKGEEKPERYGNALGWLFCAKVRKQRPQGAAYTYIPKELWDSFDECGPERETGMGNPYKPGEYLR